MKCSNHYYNNIKIFYVLVLAAFSIIPMALALYRQGVIWDSSYYLSAVERIRCGYKLYEDIPFEYPPVFVYMAAFVKDLFSLENNYTLDLFLFYLLIFGICISIYLILRTLNVSVLLSVTASLLFIPICFSFEGQHVLLEVPSIVFGSFGVFCLLRYRNSVSVVAAGILMAMSSMTKQYAIVFAFIGLLLIIMNQGKSWKELLLYILVFVICMKIMFLVFPEMPYLNSTYTGYGERSLWASLKGFKNAVLDLCRHLPLLPFSFIGALILFPKMNYEQKSFVIVLILGMIGFSGQFMFAYFRHYDIYLVFFLVLLLAYEIHMVKSDRGRALLTSVLAVVLITSSCLFYKHSYAFPNKLYQKEMTEELTSMGLANTDNVYLWDGFNTYPQYYLSNIRPPMNDYSFGVPYDVSLDWKMLRLCDYTIVEEGCPKDEYLRNYLLTEFEEIGRLSSRCIVYKRNFNPNALID